MSAYALVECTKLNKDLVEQINNAPSKVEILYLEAPIEVLQRAQVELKEFMESGAEFNTEAYSQILKEVEYLANPNT